MDDTQFIGKLKSLGLDKLQKASEVADQNDPDMPFVLEAIKQLKTQGPAFMGPPSTSLPLRPEQQAHIDRQLATTARPLPMPSSLGEAAWEGIKGAGRQVAGDAAALMSNLPSIPAGLEAVGDYAHEVTRGHPVIQGAADAILPRPGDTQRAIENAPSPTAARAFGMTAPMAAATRGAGAAPGLITKIAQKVLPEFVKEGAATAGDLVNTAMAPATKLYQGIQGATKAAGPLASNLIAGGGTNFGVALADAGIQRIPAAVTPGRQVPPVDIAREIALPTAAGVAGALPGGIHASATRNGFQDTEGAKVARKFVETKLSGAEDTNPLLAGKARGNLGMQQVEQAGQEAIASKAAEQEPAMRSLFSQKQKRLTDEFTSVIDRYEHKPIPNADSTGASIDSKVNEVILPKAKSGTEFSDSGPEFLGTGSALSNTWGKIRNYIAGGTVRDYRNAISELKMVSESGTPEKTFPARAIIGTLKEHLKDAYPEVRSAYENYRIGRGHLERASEIGYGEGDLNKLGEKTAHGRLDTADPGDPFIQMTPGREARGRTNLSQIGETTPAALNKKPAIEELEAAGFSRPVGEMQQTRADVESANEAKWALEKSRFPSSLELLHPAGQLAAAATMGNPIHGSSMAAVGGSGLMSRLGQWSKSMPALRLRGFEGEAGQAASIGAGSQAAEALSHNRFPSVDDMVNQAREHAQKAKRWGATIFER
jgi:hypothetical protein